MKNYLVIFILSALMSTGLNAQELIDGQDKSKPLYTELTKEILQPYKSLFTKEGFDLEGIKGLRMYLKPFAKKGDPMGMFMYAKVHDLYPYRKGSVADAKIAFEYFKKASEAGLADASYVLYGHYRNGYMQLPKDSHKALEYLQRTIKQGNATTKAAMLTGLARLHQSPNGETGVNPSFPAVRYDKNKTQKYLAEAVKHNPNNVWAKSALADINKK